MLLNQRCVVPARDTSSSNLHYVTLSERMRPRARRLPPPSRGDPAHDHNLLALTVSAALLTFDCIVAYTFDGYILGQLKANREIMELSQKPWSASQAYPSPACKYNSWHPVCTNPQPQPPCISTLSLLTLHILLSVPAV